MAYCTQLPPLRQSSIDRFWAKVRKKSDGCWEWTGALSRGYGHISYRGTDGIAYHMGAHRLSFLLAGRTIPDGFVIDHLCRNRACVNPDHLEAVTSAENALRGESPTIIVHHSDFCTRGHPRTEENTLWHQNGKWMCRVCRQINQRQYRRGPDGILLRDVPRTCVECGKTFYSSVANRVTCGPECKRLHHRKWNQNDYWRKKNALVFGDDAQAGDQEGAEHDGA